MLLPVPMFGICGDFILVLIKYLCFSSLYVLAFRTCFLGIFFPVVYEGFLHICRESDTRHLSSSWSIKKQET